MIALRFALFSRHKGVLVTILPCIMRHIHCCKQIVDIITAVIPDSIQTIIGRESAPQNVLMRRLQEGPECLRQKYVEEEMARMT